MCGIVAIEAGVPSELHEFEEGLKSIEPVNRSESSQVERSSTVLLLRSDVGKTA